MGIEITSTCTPYYGANLPKFGDHIAWSESSAVIFANSIIGARTNREGGPSSLAAAIVGKTPNYGLHLEENRKATVIVEVNAKLKDFADYSFLGYYLGKALKNDIPYFETPEYKYAIEDKLEKIQVEEKDLEEVKEKFKIDWSEIDAIVIGCPHASIQEVKEIAKLLKIREKPPKIPVLITASRVVKALADTLGYTEVIERYNGKIIADACLIVSPVENWHRGIATNSGKASFYFSSFGLKVRLEDTEKLILEAP
ncbi:MAG: mevalonate 5-phosphate dehydratase large subunit [Thermococcaceae archaeon]|nr:mevalonate 5-phosphate dehydratase large subunit [Thermococcaceae archaeon]